MQSKTSQLSGAYCLARTMGHTSRCSWGPFFFEGGYRFCADVPNETADTDQRVSTTVGEHIVRKTSRSNWPNISWFRRCLEQEPPKQNLRYRPKGFRNGWGTHIERELNFGEFDEFTKESARTRSTAELLEPQRR